MTSGFANMFNSIGSIFRSILEKTEIILLIAIILPLIFAFDVTLIKGWIELLLGIVMFLSIRPFFKQKLEASKSWKAIAISIALSYVVLSGVYILFASIFFAPSSDYFTGFILLALVPPAVSIVPLCYLTRCNFKVADTAIVVSYLLALIIIPLGSLLVFGKNFNIWMLLRTLTVLIVIPLLLAYFTRNVSNKVSSTVSNYTKISTNILIGMIVLISISLNRSLLLNVFDAEIRTIILICVLAIFVLGLATYYLGRKLSSEIDAIDYSLYVTQKNEATGLAMAILMFNSTVAIPLIIALVVQFLYFIVFERFVIKVE